MKIVTFLLSFAFAFTVAPSNAQFSSFISLVTPKIVPHLLGTFRFDTLESVPFSLNATFPSTARKISVTAFIRSGMNSGEATVNLWLWTECLDKGILDTKFKRAYRYHQEAYAFDSETLELFYCSSDPVLHVTTDYPANNVQLELYATGYSTV